MEKPQSETVMARVREALKATSLDDVADRLQEKRATVGSWSARNSVPLDALIKVAAIAKCSLDWLVLGEQQAPGSAYAASQRVIRSAKEGDHAYGEVMHYRRGGRDVSFVLVPRYSVSASAGPGHDNGHEADGQVGEIAFEAGWMRAHFGRAGAGFALLDVAGNSMEPTLWDGETILVDLQSREVVSGGVYVLRDGDELLVKRLQRLIGGGVEVVSDNATFRSQEVKDPAHLTVIGRVVWPKVR